MPECLQLDEVENRKQLIVLQTPYHLWTVHSKKSPKLLGTQSTWWICCHFPEIPKSKLIRLVTEATEMFVVSTHHYHALIVKSLTSSQIVSIELFEVVYTQLKGWSGVVMWDQILGRNLHLSKLPTTLFLTWQTVFCLLVKPIVSIESETIWS